MNNRSTEVSLGDIDNLDLIDPYATPAGVYSTAEHNLKAIKFNKNGLIFTLLILVLTVFSIVLILEYGSSFGVNPLYFAIPYIANIVTDIVLLYFIFRLNQVMYSDGKAFLILLLSLIPFLGLYMAIRSVFLANVILRRASKT